jgi:hypothetical protein
MLSQVQKEGVKNIIYFVVEKLSSQYNLLQLL